LRVLIIGAGVVGEVTALGMLALGHEVAVVDIKKEKFDRLENRGIECGTKLDEIELEPDVTYACLPVFMSVDGVRPKYSECKYEVLKDYACDVLQTTNSVFAVRSTLPPTTMKKLSDDVEEIERLVYNPEFLRETSAFSDFMNPDRIVIGAESDRAFWVVRDSYRGIEAPVIRVSWIEAELIKLISNAFLATKISFFNEVWRLGTALRVDIYKVAEAVAADRRIGSYGIYGGRPYAGKCLPKDVAMLLKFAEEVNVDLKLVKAVRDVNRSFGGE